ncbi:uncharacterized protein LOC117564011 isoform X1 [Drosophila albomicans]|uniref:Uncharacterized protein LOC117564011 isoform X1 n=1 Tax=Drosophila albomicans TaxID=7291 RepID=A0A6P8W4D7_DROAB|nr:uncharacterized protein LOC117564011 isoform X1 [Drosophila albomicans]
MQLKVGILLLMLSAVLVVVEAEMTSTPDDSTTSSGSSSTSAPPASDKNKLITHLIEHILATSKTGHYVGNVEFDQQSTILRIAGNLGEESLALKHHAYEKFISYNALRLKLEGDIDSRIAVIDNYFHTQRLSDACKLFYHLQKKDLLIADTETNSLKAFKLTINSENCPYQTVDSDESDSDEEYDPIWDIWNTILG